MMYVYIASFWSTPNQIKTYNIIHKALDDFFFECYYPKEQFEFKSGEKPSEKKLDKVFKDNLKAINQADFLISSTEDTDAGVLFESGYAYAYRIPIVYCCFTLGDKPFNLMMQRSCIAVAKNEKELTEILTIITAEGLESDKLKSYLNRDTIE